MRSAVPTLLLPPKNKQPICLPRCRDYEAKSALDSYESAGIDNEEVAVGGYEEQLAARMRADEAMDAREGGQRRGRKRALPGALEGE